MTARNRGAITFHTPTIFGLVNSPKAGLVLKHETDFSRLVENFHQFMDSGVNFFEVAMTSSLAFFGCLLLGITFRQSWRCNTRYICPLLMR
jgi:hypothetical protein